MVGIHCCCEVTGARTGEAEPVGVASRESGRGESPSWRVRGSSEPNAGGAGCRPVEQEEANRRKLQSNGVAVEEFKVKRQVQISSSESTPSSSLATTTATGRDGLESAIGGHPSSSRSASLLAILHTFTSHPHPPQRAHHSPHFLLEACVVVSLLACARAVGE